MRGPSVPTPEEVAAAEAALFRTVEAIDPGTGAVTRRRVEAPLYRDYLASRAAHEAARARYAEAQEEAQRSEDGRRSWPMIAGTHQLAVRQAYDRWRAAGADQVERALAVLARAGLSPT